MIRNALATVAVALASAGSATSQSFVNFESPQTHPIAISADGTQIFAVNTPDNRLSVFSTANPNRPILLREIPVGLEPVSVAVRNPNEVWVVNRVGDSISVVSPSQGIVTATIRMKDEPADVVFAGDPAVAIVSVSGSDEVRFVDPDSHALLATVPVFGDEPRALRVDASGSTAWVAAQRSGNRTTIIAEADAPPPPPPTNGNLPAAPPQGILVDSTDPTWQSTHGITLPDYDVFELNVATRSVTRRYSGVGTTLFNLDVHPNTGDLWVANTEALNLTRFEPNLRGHFVDNRVTRITRGTTPTVTPIDLNPTINYAVMPNAGASASALAQPTDLVIKSDGSEIYVVAFGTDRVGFLDGNGAVTGFVELGTAGAATDPRSKRGPRALVEHPSQDRLYVLNRISMTLATINSATRTLTSEISIGYDPTPTAIASGRGFLYDAKLSGNGTASCAACHIDGEQDGIGWDLGDPGGDMQTFQHNATINGFTIPLQFNLHPMKGPMTTQTLRGMTPNVAPFHWRGDRDELQAFNPAFDALMGGAELSTTDMDDYAAFLKTLAFPPNPNQNMNRTLATTPAGTSAQDGFNFYTSVQFIPLATCNTCHALPTGTNGSIIPGNLLQESQPFKVPQLRNAYKHTGRDPVGGMSKSGFGYLHDGSINSVFDLLTLPVFQSLSSQPNNKTKLQNFVLSMDTGLAPTVGYQVTVTQANVNDARIQADLTLLQQEVVAGNCGLIAKGTFLGDPRGFAWNPATLVFDADTAALGTFSTSQLLTQISLGNATLTFMGTPVGAARRMGVDRELNGVLDGDEGLVSYGSPSPACGSQMTLSGNSAPHIGNDVFAVLTDNAPAASAGAYFFSSGSASLPFLDLTFLVDLGASLSLPAPSDANGVGLFELPIPDDPSLVGITLFSQAIFPEPCGQIGLGMSNGLQITFGQS